MKQLLGLFVACAVVLGMPTYLLMVLYYVFGVGQ